MTQIKFGQEATTFKEKFTHLKHLATAHDGELVQTGSDAGWKLFPAFGQSLTADGWNLVWLSQSLTADFGLSPQFYMHDREGSSSKDVGYVHREENYGRMRKEMRKVMARHAELRENDLKPDWQQQKYHLMAPCKKTSKFFWGRIGSVVSLGEWFDELSDPVTDRPDDSVLSAAVLYYVYLHKQLVSVKRFKLRPAVKAPLKRKMKQSYSSDDFPVGFKIKPLQQQGPRKVRKVYVQKD